MITILENDKDIYYSAIPREEEGMGICAGAYLGNKLPCIMMQNTGIGNSVNSIVFFATIPNASCFLDKLSRHSWRTSWSSGGMASVTEDILNTLRIPMLHCNTEDDLDKISTFTNHAKVIESPVAVLCNFNLMKDD